MDNVAAAPPVYIRNAMCGIYPDYVKKKHTFKLNSSDGAEYLFSAENNFKMIEWVEKINFHAQLAPPNQLTSFQQGSNEGLPMYSPPSNPSNELMRSHTLELHTSSSNRNSIYLGDDDPRKSSTLDPRRPTSAGNERSFIRVFGKDTKQLHYDEHEFHTSRLEMTASTISGLQHPPLQPEISFSSGSTTGQPTFNGSGNDDAEFVKWIENSSSNIQGSDKKSPNEDTDSLKSKKRSGFNLFKRSSKTAQKDVSK